MPPDALLLAQNAPECIWRPSSAPDPLGELERPPSPLAAKEALLLRVGGGRREGGGGKGRAGEKRGGKGLTRPLCRSFRRLWVQV